MNRAVLLLVGTIATATTEISASNAQETRVKDLNPQTQADALQPLVAQTQFAQVLETPTPASAAPQPQQRSRSGFYGAVSGNARFFKQTTLRPINVEIDLSPGYGVNASLGYKFGGGLRVEGEFSYGSNNVNEVRLPEIPATTTVVLNTVPVPGVPLTIANSITSPIAIPVPGVGIIPAGATIPAGTVLNPGNPPTLADAIQLGAVTVPAGTPLSVPGITTTGGTPPSTTQVATNVTTPAIPAIAAKTRGKITTTSGLFNLYYDFPTNSRFEPYVGAGIGVSHASAKNLSASYPGTTLSTSITGSSTVLVYQLMAGVGYNVSSNTAITVGYRYFNIAKQSFNVEPVGKVNADGIGVHNIEVGLRYSF